MLSGSDQSFRSCLRHKGSDSAAGPVYGGVPTRRLLQLDVVLRNGTTRRDTVKDQAKAWLLISLWLRWEPVINLANKGWYQSPLFGFRSGPLQNCSQPVLKTGLFSSSLTVPVWSSMRTKTWPVALFKPRSNRWPAILGHDGRVTQTRPFHPGSLHWKQRCKQWLAFYLEEPRFKRLSCNICPLIFEPGSANYFFRCGMPLTLNAPDKWRDIASTTVARIIWLLGLVI